MIPNWPWAWPCWNCTTSYKFSVSVKKMGEGWTGGGSDILKAKSSAAIGGALAPELLRAIGVRPDLLRISNPLFCPVFFIFLQSHVSRQIFPKNLRSNIVTTSDHSCPISEIFSFFPVFKPGMGSWRCTDLRNGTEILVRFQRTKNFKSDFGKIVPECPKKKFGVSLNSDANPVDGGGVSGIIWTQPPTETVSSTFKTIWWTYRIANWTNDRHWLGNNHKTQGHNMDWFRSFWNFNPRKIWRMLRESNLPWR